MSIFFLFWSVRMWIRFLRGLCEHHYKHQSSMTKWSPELRVNKEKRFFPKYITLYLYIPWVLKSVLFILLEVGWSETTLDQIIARFKWHPVQAPSYIEIMTSGHVCLFIKTPNDGELMNSQYSPQIFGKLYKKAHHHHHLLLLSVLENSTS